MDGSAAADLRRYVRNHRSDVAIHPMDELDR